MTETQKELARHALGLPNKRRKSYRNHYVVRGCGDDHVQWMEMVSSGEARRWPPSELTGGDDLFRLTRSGAMCALLPRERLSAEDFPEVQP